MWFKRKQRKGKTKKKDIWYHLSIVERAYPLVSAWNLRLRNCTDPNRAKRIIKHMRRIAVIQQLSQAEMKRQR